MIVNLSVTQWQQLAEAAIECNPFYEPWFLLAHIEHLKTKILRVISFGQSDRLDAFFPLERDSEYPWKWLPGVKVLRTVTSPFLYLSAPLLRTEGVPSLQPAFEAAFADDPSLQAVSIGPLYRDSELFENLQRGLAGLPTLAWRNTIRPYFSSALRAGEYCTLHLGRQHEKKLLKKRKKLGTFKASLDINDALIEDFLQLERAGWKGEEGTAMACRSDTEQFFRAVMKNGATQARVRCCGIQDEKSQALKVLFTNSRKDFGFKICFDETLHHLSPGSVLESYLVEQRLAHIPRIEADSCAKSGAELFTRLWKTDRILTELLVFRPNPAGKSLRSLVMAGRKLKLFAPK